MLSTTTKTTRREETVEEFLARGGQIERIEAYPDSDGRVLLRGQREHVPLISPRLFNPPSRDVSLEVRS